MTDITVSGHNIQFPLDVMGQTGLVQVVLNHSQFAQSLQTRAFKGGVTGEGDGQSQGKGPVLDITIQRQGP